MAWTTDQLLAINKDHQNILVSAGAGSGKTAVLTERVLRKIKDGIHINELLILTFTNAAAKEMKDRIRMKLKKENLTDEVNLIDSAYITTFDSFSLSIVKKYHTNLNISRNIGIADHSLLSIKKREILDQIFNEYYQKEDPLFEQLIHDFCFKNDEKLKKLILQLSEKLDTKYDKKLYLTTYLDEKFNLDSIHHDIHLFFLELKEMIDTTKSMIEELSYHLDSSYIYKLEDILSRVYEAKNYDELFQSLEFRLPPLPRGSSEEVKQIKEELSKIIKEVRKIAIYSSSDEIIDEVLSTKNTISIIIQILLQLENLLFLQKRENNLFDFSDISRMAIEVVSHYPEVLDEIKHQFQEIMIDEYQDTNDIQEYFISLISKDNVYMVGDIKQSIYRFRNANPYIFKSKYDLYSTTNQGLKIELLKNFRSRFEVLEDINFIFNDLMDDEYGGANYLENHQMVFGNQTYQEEGETKQNQHLEILMYDCDSSFSNLEKEMFIIGRDILDKIKNKYQVFDQKNMSLRDVTYQDFVILIDRSVDFIQYKKVFEYLKIPLTVYKDEGLKGDYDISIIRNLLKLICLIDQDQYGVEFRYYFTSIARSFLFSKSDQEIFDYFYHDRFKESDIYLCLTKLYDAYYELSPNAFFLKMLDIFDYEHQLLTIGNVEKARIRLEYFYQMISSFSQSGKNIQEFIDYLDDVFEHDIKVDFSINDADNNSVKIMTIHKSKGLEFPICYFAGLYKEFSFQELNDQLLYHEKYGLIAPYIDEYIKPTIYKQLMIIDNKKEEISEKIRLFYVALTRAREKMIFVIPEVEKKIYSKNSIKSFLDMFLLIDEKLESFKRKIDCECSKDYLIHRNEDSLEKFITDQKIAIDEIYVNFDVFLEEKFSKSNSSLVTKEEKERMEFGIKIHEVLEMIDFHHPDYSLLDDFSKNVVEKFIQSDLIQRNLDAKFYKEYEFIDNENDEVRHGIIDLMIENDQEIIIVDYKLKNVLDEEYEKQIRGYERVIKSRTTKKVSAYLYSIMDNKLIQIEKSLV